MEPFIGCLAKTRVEASAGNGDWIATAAMVKTAYLRPFILDYPTTSKVRASAAV